MNKKYYSKLSNILLALISLISLVTTPLPAIVYAENEFGDDRDGETVVVPKVTGESDTNNESTEKEENVVQPEPVAEQSETLATQPEPALEQTEPVVEAEVV